MESTYLFLNIFTISIPLLYSIFEKKFHFIQYIKPYLLANICMAIPFLIWDAWFTEMGVWGFNADYHLNILIFKMPLEEILFFLCIPYACIFSHQGLRYYFPNLQFSSSVSSFMIYGLIIAAFILLFIGYDNWYTMVNSIFFLVVVGIGLWRYRPVLFRFMSSYTIILVPFVLVNGVLTGAISKEPVVWYNNAENVGFRIGTIPIEDFLYCFSMLWLCLLFFEIFKNKKTSSN